MRYAGFDLSQDEQKRRCIWHGRKPDYLKKDVLLSQRLNRRGSSMQMIEVQAADTAGKLVRLFFRCRAVHFAA
jgi:hypothetical protein